MLVLVCNNMPVESTGYHTALVHATNGHGSIFGMGRACCPLKAAQRACRVELAWRARMARREAPHRDLAELPLWAEGAAR